MTFQFTNNHTIQLDTLLYIASNSKHIQNERKKLFFLLFSILLILGFLFLFFDFAIGTIFLLISCVALVIFPKFYSYAYAKSCSKMVTLNNLRNKESFETTFEIQVDSNYILIKNKWVESKHQLAHISFISETANYFFVYLKTDSFLIFPKEQTADYQALKLYFEDICQRESIPFKQELDWRWQ